jgi:hypothetical protein
MRRHVKARISYLRDKVKAGTAGSDGSHLAENLDTYSSVESTQSSQGAPPVCVAGFPAKLYLLVELMAAESPSPIIKQTQISDAVEAADTALASVQSAGGKTRSLVSNGVWIALIKAVGDVADLLNLAGEVCIVWLVSVSTSSACLRETRLTLMQRWPVLCFRLL